MYNRASRTPSDGFEVIPMMISQVTMQERANLVPVAGVLLLRRLFVTGGVYNFGHQ